MDLCWIRKRWVMAIVPLCLLVPGIAAQAPSKVQPQATAEDALAALVHQSAVIFAGEVYAIRVPQGVSNGVSGGLPSTRPDTVEIEFRVDMGIRGTSIGSNYVLHMPLSAWQQAPLFTLHERAVNFLAPADASGFSSPVQSDADLPGMDVGVMPVDRANQVDMTRLQRLVTRKTIATMTAAPNPALPGSPPVVSDVTTQSREDTLISGSNQGRMPELRSSAVLFLALVRDVMVLSAAEAPQGAAPAATK